ncbi:hypothetical protein SDC9_207168 [bioreactor metagenome]|uniref:Uncharacterized protein n=1 Tax=bioreactor metagenome TaxID=1076179 RepID=A0A645J7S2_9ZZZZ
MILFDTEHIKLFNYIIHHFLEVEIYNEDNDDVDIADQIEIIMPKYLFREQYIKCKKVFEELYRWTEDEFYHGINISILDFRKRKTSSQL